MRQKVLIILSFLFAFPVYGNDKYYFFEQVSMEGGFAFDGIITIVEDQYGFVWFGGASGLYYYNTKQFAKHFSDPLKIDTPPSDRIQKLYRDSFEKIWVCTEDGLCYFNEPDNSFVRISLKDSTGYIEPAMVNSIVQYKDRDYLVVINNELYILNLDAPVLRKVRLGDGSQKVSYLARNEDKRIYAGTTSGQVFMNTSSIDMFAHVYSSQAGSVKSLSIINNQFWIAFENNGIEVVDSKGDLLSSYREENTGEYHLPHNSVRKIIQRKNGEIWIGTYRGLVVLSDSSNRIITHDPYNGLPHNSIYELFIDRNEGIWIGTWSGGLAYYSDFNYKFPHIEIIRNNVPISNSVISSFTEDRNGDILVGSETNGIFRFNPEKNSLRSVHTANDRKSSERVKSIVTDKNGTHWFGGFQNGLFYMNEDKIKVALKNRERYIISSLLAVDSGIWIGTRDFGLRFYNTNRNSVESYFAEEDKVGSISSDRIWSIFQDSKENLWITSDFGLTVKYKGEKEFKRYYTNENPASLSQNFNYTIEEDKSGKLWIGSGGGGINIFDPDSKSFSRFRLNDAVKDLDVYCIVCDTRGNIWFSSNQGIYVYFTSAGKLKKFSEQQDLLGSKFQPNSGFLSSTGKIFFGGANGFIVIDPDIVKENQVEPEVFLSRLIIDNRPLGEQPPRFINSDFPAGIDRLELNYNQNSLSFEFAANNFIKSDENRFRYRLVNYLDEWIESEHGNYISFTKIPPGSYILQVLASNNDGVWTKVPREIQIKIYPPVWATWYAFLAYILIVSTIVIAFVRNRQKIASERYKHAADEFLFSEKVKFFTNISHEFRTPLTLILSPLDHLMERLTNHPDLMDHLKVIKRNSERLLRLTNQILDFRLIELNKVKLNIEKTEIVSLSRNVYDCFEYQITKKQINCIFTSPFKSFYLPVDSEKIDKVIYNILSNALRYSDEKGQIIVSLEQKTLSENNYSNVFCTGNKFIGESLEIKIKDNGKGIKPGILPRIFDRFFMDNETEKTGTGIGLHICQEYIVLHKGNIMVTSEPGIGTTFMINIPVSKDIEYDKEPMIIQYHFDRKTENEEDIEPYSKLADENKIILFVEDNDDHRMYFKKVLSSRYKVLTAKNGQQAFEIAREVIPDMIISDILMPGMGGMELIDKIRQTNSTKHIPIIILTALSDDKSKIDSIQKGADDFITKPVKENYIFAKIEHIFKNIDFLKQTYTVKGKEIIAQGRNNETFLQKAERIVMENLQDPSFDIEKFATVLNMSRSSFHRKLKNKVNLSPSEFVRDIRLKKAVELIKEGNLNMDEIGFMVGFNSQSYFIRSFKARYGKTPTTFKAELSREK